MGVSLKILFENNKVFKGILISISTILLILILISASLLSNLITSSIENSKASAIEDNLSNQIKKANLELFNKRLLTGFDNDQLRKISQKYLIYTLSVNGDPVKTNTIQSKTPNIVVVISESYDPLTEGFLPKDIIQYGSILSNDNAMSLLKISSNASKFKTQIDYADNKKLLSYNLATSKLVKSSQLKLNHLWQINWALMIT